MRHALAKKPQLPAADAGLNPVHIATLLRRASDCVWPVDCTVIRPGNPRTVVPSVMRVRVSRLLRSCAVLVDAGYVPEIAGNVRSVWEDAVSVAYMAESPSDRAAQWASHAEAERRGTSVTLSSIPMDLRKRR